VRCRGAVYGTGQPTSCTTSRVLVLDGSCRHFRGTPSRSGGSSADVQGSASASWRQRRPRPVQRRVVQRRPKAHTRASDKRSSAASRRPTRCGTSLMVPNRSMKKSRVMPDMARLGDPAQTSSQCWKMDRNDPAPRLGKRSASGGGPAAPVPGLCRGASRSEWRRRSNPGMLVSPATRGSCCRRKHSRGPTAAASRRFFMAKVGYEVIGALLRATRGALEPAESRRGPAIAVAAGDDYGPHPIRVRRSSHSLVDDRVQQRTLVRQLGIVRIRHTAPRLS
jgi:hypothetical protein